MGKGSHGHPRMFGNRLEVLEICHIGSETSQFSSCYPRELPLQRGREPRFMSCPQS